MYAQSSLLHAPKVQVDLVYCKSTKSVHFRRRQGPPAVQTACIIALSTSPCNCIIEGADKKLSLTMAVARTLSSSHGIVGTHVVAVWRPLELCNKT